MAPKTPKERIDILVVEQGFAASREKAQALIRAGLVLANDTRIDKPGTKVSRDAALRVKGGGCPYVSRGGLKLEGALNHFGIDPSGRVALDVGSSTGGFTDVLLQRGATRVFAVDVGTNQLDYKIRTDERVVVMEKTNFRTLPGTDKAEQIRAGEPTLVVGDVSFISLTQILPSIPPLVSGPTDLIFLIKPQFEAGRGEIGKGGIVRDPNVRAATVEKICTFAQEDLQWSVHGVIESPIQGTQGNIEYLMHATTEVPSEN